MSNHRILSEIRANKKLSKKFDKLSTAGKQKVLEEADNDTWHIDEIIDNILKEEKRGI